MRAHGTRSRSSDERDVTTRQVVAPSAPVERILTLQRLAGNAAVARSVEAERHQHGPGCGHASPAVQRREAPHEHGPGCGHGGVEDTGPTAQRSLLDAARNTPSTSLPGAFLAKAKPFFQNDRLSEGRVHENPIAQRATAALGAEAMTVGKHIFLGPKAVGNTKTLVHEASHLDKNIRGIPETGNNHGAGLTVTDPGQGSERAADTDSDAFMSGAGTAPSVVAQRSLTEQADGTDTAVQRSTGGGGGTDTVQRVGDEDVQDRLSRTYWESARNSTKLQKGTDNKGKGRGGKKGSGSQGTSPARTPEQMLKEIIPGLLEELDALSSGNPEGAQLKLFRTMPNAEADAILAWQAGKKEPTEAWMRNPPEEKAALTFRQDATVGEIPLHNHLGDEKQARDYYNMGNDESRTQKKTLMFVLKPDAHKLFFSPQYMALSATGEGPAAIRNSDKVEGGRFPTAAGGEGNLPGYIGVKSERRGDISLVVKNQPTRLLFQTFISKVVEA